MTEEIRSGGFPLFARIFRWVLDKGESSVEWETFKVGIPGKIVV
jgi:hypothetical protein